MLTDYIGRKPEKFTQGKFEHGGGFASYAKVDGQWLSINGSAQKIVDVRWDVIHVPTIEKLEAATK